MPQLAFYKGKGTMLDRLIRWATRGQYSHVELVLRDDLHDGSAYCFSSSSRDGGTRFKNIDINNANWDIVPIHFLVASQYMEILDEVNKKYDYAGILLSQVLNLRRENPKQWFCSEICAAALGIPNPATYSPNTLKDIAEYLNRTPALEY